MMTVSELAPAAAVFFLFIYLLLNRSDILAAPAVGTALNTLSLVAFVCYLYEDPSFESPTYKHCKYVSGQTAAVVSLVLLICYYTYIGCANQTT